MPTVEDYLGGKGEDTKPLKNCNSGLIPIGFKNDGEERLYTCRRPGSEIPIEGNRELTRVKCLGRRCPNFRTAIADSTPPQEGLLYRSIKSGR